jgi:ferritin-like protein
MARTGAPAATARKGSSGLHCPLQPQANFSSKPVTQKEHEMSSVGYHEPVEELSAETRDMHRAIVSLMEELEAVDWYNQRADACKDPALKAILVHNRDEEKEHAAMVLEWIRRKDPSFSSQLKDYVFTDEPIAHP